MKVLINAIAGSRSYGLNTPESDYDTRGVFFTENLKKLFGIHKNQRTINSEKDDGVLWECVHFFNMLKKGNTQALEILYADSENILQSDPIFIEMIINNKEKLIDTSNMCTSLLGYSKGEMNKTFNYHGSLGGKRKAVIDEIGYSYKNAVQCLRLLQCGIWFLQDKHFYVNIGKKSEEFRKKLFDIKTNATNYSVDQIKSFIIEKQNEFIDISEYRDRSDDFIFDDEYALNFIKRSVSELLG